MRGKLNCRVLISALLLGAFIFVLPLAAERVEDVPNPRPANGGYVADNGGVLGPEYIRLIDAACRELQAKTTIELAVVTVADMGGLEIEEFAEKLFRSFAIGAKGKDSGLLLLCSRDDRALRLEVGYGLESVIPDARAGSLLDVNAMPYLRNGQFGRGLFLAAREVARAAASAQGVALDIAEPSPWPGQVAPPAPLARPLAAKKTAWDPLQASLYFALGLLVLAILGFSWTLLRFSKSRGRAARAKVIGQAWMVPIFVGVAAVIGFFLVLGFGKSFFPPFAAMLGIPGLATASQLLTGRLLKRRLASYRIACGTCGAAMDMAAGSQEEKFLSAEQAAEEKAGGMDYEFWHCSQCGADENLEVKLGKAGVCPQCKRRSLTSSTATLAAATQEQAGRVRVIASCLNPKCNFSQIREHATPRLSSPSSSSPGSSRSSSGSFGGGRSGGGGASKHF
jgi:uncharacterized protein